MWQFLWGVPSIQWSGPSKNAPRKDIGEPWWTGVRVLGTQGSQVLIEVPSTSQPAGLKGSDAHVSPSGHASYHRTSPEVLWSSCLEWSDLLWWHKRDCHSIRLSRWAGVPERRSRLVLPFPQPCMAAMAPALTDAPAEARHIRLKLAAASSGLSPGSAENNGNATNLLLSSSVSASTATAANGKRRLPPDSEDGCRSCCCNGKGQPQEPLSLGKLQPLVASYLCSDVAPVAKESLKVQGVLKSHSLLNGSLFHGAEGGDFLLRKALSGGGQAKGLVNGRRAVGTGGSAMVPVNGLAKKAAVPSTALPEKGCVATVNGDNTKPPTSGEALLPLSSKSGDVMPLISAPRGDGKHQRESLDVFSRAPEDTGLAPHSLEVKSEAGCPPSCGRLQSSRSRALTETSSDSTDRLEDPQASQAPRCPSPTSSLNLEALLQERAQQSRRRHTDLSGRLQRLCKRLQVVQAKQVERHVRQQVSGFLDCALTQSFAFSRRADLHTDSLGHFLKGGSVPSELEKLHLSGSTNLRTAEAQFDSDATESSSGGESDVEEEELSRVDIEQRHVKLWRRAEGRFALERASIISRWTWLQAHISDLEYRIRQQADIYRQIRTSKGSVELGDTATSGQTRADKADPLSTQSAAEGLSQFSRSQTDRGMTEVSASDSSCTSARVRPLTSCKRRRLIQPSTVQNLNGKVQRVCCSPTRQCDVNASCVMCGGDRLPSKAELPYERPLVERVALHDPNIHPTLSLPSDMPLCVQFQRVLKSHWQTRRVEKLKPTKKISLKHKVSLFSSSSSTSALSKHKFRLSNSHMAAVRLSRHKSRSEKARRQQAEGSVHVPALDTHTTPPTHTPCRTERLLDRSLNRKRTREHSLDRTESPKLLMDAGSPCPSQSSTQPSTPSSLSRQLSLPTDISTPLASSSQPGSGSGSMPIRKRRSENSFDINNIVIPMSVAATTRVEKLQYKEIITPSWREVDVLSRPLCDEDEDENVEVEDVSDAAFSQLHQKYEDQERSRWRWTAQTPATRRGSRSYKSLDGRTTPSLSGTNPSTPQPSSPDTGHFHLLQDYGPVPSPLSPPSPDTPCSRDAHTPHSRDAHRLGYSEDTRCSTPDCTYEEKTVQPWEHRSFPLSEDPVAEPQTEPTPHHQRLPLGLRTTSHCRAGSESEASSP
ncbi:KAT8 regulatory NSL complex subunit 1 isoform X2 [Salminus brasiliensis]|uniref:KAT8 regulatory NSL complex subunit 1 isoform X2 n=1 Tax=Salminus brasiliensis TaxID=930266 RepID=UPI003B83656C